MGALEGTLTERSKASLMAGCDLVLHCNDDFAARLEVAEACGEMSDAAQARAEAALALRRTPQEIDIPRAEADLEALLNGPVYV
jgi:beta-N-acetylhexosaminidase